MRVSLRLGLEVVEGYRKLAGAGGGMSQHMREALKRYLREKGVLR